MSDDPFPRRSPWWLHWLVGCPPELGPQGWCNRCFYRAWDKHRSPNKVRFSDRPYARDVSE